MEGLAAGSGERVSVSRPRLSESQVRFRLELARQRTETYPLDMDFIMIDLERPERRTRHAHWCTGDLTGRLLEFLSCAEGVDGVVDARLPELFERIWKQRAPSGLFGRVPRERQDGLAGSDKVFHGMVRYFELTSDARALEGAQGIAEHLMSSGDRWRESLEKARGRFIQAWVSEPMARLYGITGDTRYLDFCGMVREYLGDCSAPCHSHGFLSTLRGLQIAGLLTGDAGWNEKPEENRGIVSDRRYEMPDGCISEGFPNSSRNEGCSIADWLMLNLNAGLLLGDDAAYERADRVLWNALAFNQWITGAFGHRGTTQNGYGAHLLEEAWWCCLENGGMALAEYARHAVTIRGQTVHVNFLLPGRYAVTLSDGREVEVRIETKYPAEAESAIEVDGVPADVAVKLRVPACIGTPDVSETRTGDSVRLSLKGRIGHRIEECDPGVMLMYGALVLAPATYGWSRPTAGTPGDSTVPPGYIPQSLPEGVPTLKVGSVADADGYLHLSNEPLPAWTYFDEGPGGRCWVPGAAVNAPVQFDDGEVRELRFTPLCYNTTNLSLWETPIVFGGVSD